jgi:hypothetical protein
MSYQRRASEVFQVLYPRNDIFLPGGHSLDLGSLVDYSIGDPNHESDRHCEDYRFDNVVNQPGLLLNIFTQIRNPFLS